MLLMDVFSSNFIIFISLLRAATIDFILLRKLEHYNQKLIFFEFDRKHVSEETQQQYQSSFENQGPKSVSANASKEQWGLL